MASKELVHKHFDISARGVGVPINSAHLLAAFNDFRNSRLSTVNGNGSDPAVSLGQQVTVRTQISNTSGRGFGHLVVDRFDGSIYVTAPEKNTVDVRLGGATGTPSILRSIVFSVPLQDVLAVDRTR